MAEEENNFNESDLEDAIIELASEIERINRGNNCGTSITNPRPITKSKIEITEIPFTNVTISRIKTTILDIPVISKFRRLIGRDLYLSEEPIVVIESLRTNNEQVIDEREETTIIDDDSEIDYSNFTLEDLFEDPIPDDPTILNLTSNLHQSPAIACEHECSIQQKDHFHEGNRTGSREFSESSESENSDRVI